MRVVGLVLPDRLLLSRGEAPHRGKRRREGGVDFLGRGEGEKGRGEEAQGTGVDVEEVLLWRRSGVEREKEVEREGEEREKKNDVVSRRANCPQSLFLHQSKESSPSRSHGAQLF